MGGGWSGLPTGALPTDYSKCLFLRVSSRLGRCSVE